ncbi:MAG: hypothetical protein V4577_22650 [Bacteroidota bacterium]
MKIKSKPYELFGLAALLILVLSFTAMPASVDLNFHDTYIVVSGHHVYWLFAVIFWFLWLLYFCFNHVLLSRKLTWAHVILTILPTVILFIAWFSINSMDGTPRRYYAFTEFKRLEKPWYKETIVYLVLLTAFIFGQLAFVFNLSGGILKRISKPAHKPKEPAN